MIERVLTVTAPSQILPVITVNSRQAVIELANTTNYPLWVQLGGARPSHLPDPTLPPGIWAYQVLPSDDMLMPAPPAGWDGNVWIGVFAPYGTLGGNITQYATVSSYTAAEVPRTASTTATATFAQPRVIMIPAMPSYANGLNPPGSGAGTQIELLTLPTAGSLFAVPITAYLYSFTLTQRGLRWLEFGLSWATVTAGPVYTTYPASGYVMTGRLFGGQIWAPPMVPEATTGISIGASVLRTVLLLQILATYPAASLPSQVDGLAQCGADLTGQPPPPGIGNGANTLQGVIY